MALSLKERQAILQSIKGSIAKAEDATDFETKRVLIRKIVDGITVFEAGVPKNGDFAKREEADQRKKLLELLEDEGLRERFAKSSVARLQHAVNVYQAKKYNRTPKIVRYEWRSMEGERYDAREEGLVSATVSDWDSALISAGSGRKIVHIFYVDDGTGNVQPYGKQTAMQLVYRDMAEHVASSRLNKIQREFERKEQERISEINWRVRDKINMATNDKQLAHLRATDAYWSVKEHVPDITYLGNVVLFKKGDMFTYMVFDEYIEKIAPRQTFIDKFASLGYEVISHDKFRDLRFKDREETGRHGNIA
ncbi:MAG: hypothetical protein IJU76_14155 [Desulfovibrionaceae bacterium]|nr:hypothetical protein [Desulfovibrionaceae bacterium]